MNAFTNTIPPASGSLKLDIKLERDTFEYGRGLPLPLHPQFQASRRPQGQSCFKEHHSLSYTWRMPLHKHYGLPWKFQFDSVSTRWLISNDVEPSFRTCVIKNNYVIELRATFEDNYNFKQALYLFCNMKYRDVPKRTN